MSSTELTQHEHSLLSKGLNFCPKPPHVDRGRLIDDNKSFNRRLRLKTHFAKAGPLYDNRTTPLNAQNESTIESVETAPLSCQENSVDVHQLNGDLAHKKEKYPKFKEKS